MRYLAAIVIAVTLSCCVQSTMAQDRSLTNDQLVVLTVGSYYERFPFQITLVNPMETTSVHDDRAWLIVETPKAQWKITLPPRVYELVSLDGEQAAIIAHIASGVRFTLTRTREPHEEGPRWRLLILPLNATTSSTGKFYQLKDDEGGRFRQILLTATQDDRAL